MPHCIAEYTPGLETGPEALATLIHQTTMDSGLFDEQAIKVRMIPVHLALQAGKPAAQLALTVKIIPGRPVEKKKALADALLAALSEDNHTTTVEVVDLEAEAYSK